MSSGPPFISRRRRPVLDRAVARWRAGNYSPALNALVDESGNGLHARFGSAVGVDTNDPLQLLKAGGYAYFPGVAANYISTPDSAGNSITGDIDIRARVEHATWRPAAQEFIIAKWNGTANQRSYALSLNATTGELLLGTSVDGTAVVTLQSTAAVPVTTGPLWLRATRQASLLECKFYTSTDGVNWVQLGTTVACLNTAIFDSTAELMLGAGNAGAGFNLTGAIHYAEVRSGLNGTVVASFSGSAQREPFATWTNPSTGEVWTLNRATAGRRLTIVDRDAVVLGVDDYLEVADSPLLNFDATQPFTLAIAMRMPAQSVTYPSFINKNTPALGRAGYSLEVNNLSALAYTKINDGTGASQITADQSFSYNVATFLAGVHASGRVRTSNGLVQTVDLSRTQASLSNAVVLRIGSSNFGSQWFEGEIFAAAIFREALSPSDLNRLRAEMGVNS